MKYTTTGGEMTQGKARRQRVIAEILRSNRFSRQDELAAALAERDMQVTQATISRDLEELGAVKVRRDGGVAYALSEEIGRDAWAGRRLESIVAEWVRSVDTAGNLVVVKTPPGSAHLVGVALDQSRLEGVVGTICGDDTLFIAVAQSRQARAIADRLSAMTGARH